MSASLLRQLKTRVAERLPLSLAADEERLEAMVGPPGVWRESRDFQIDFLRRRGLTPDDSVLDIGCGPLRGGIPLIRFLEPGRYTGYDVRPKVIKEAKRQIRRHRLKPKRPTVFVSGDFGKGAIEDASRDYIWCFQVLYHLDDELVDACFERVARQLSPDGLFYANVNTTADEGRWKEFPYVRRPARFYEDIARRHGLVMQNLGQQVEWGYTTRVIGQFNELLEFRHGREAADSTQQST